ncbi:MAG: ATP-binding protein [Candidatus Pacebacteria bacterium]|nr:ATP-binding protein [Candidatus Paceibacterota bacterium]
MEKDNTENKNSTIYYMIGVPGSGKSYVAEQKAKKYKISVLNSDNIRKELTGDAGDVNTFSHQEIFERVRSRAKEKIEAEEGFIWDATGINSKFRREEIAGFKERGAKVVAILMTTPIEICLERNRERERVVPKEVIERMDAELKSDEHKIDTDLDFFDEIRGIDENGKESLIFERDETVREKSNEVDAEITSMLKIR